MYAINIKRGKYINISSIVSVDNPRLNRDTIIDIADIVPIHNKESPKMNVTLSISNLFITHFI